MLEVKLMALGDNMGSRQEVKGDSKEVQRHLPPILDAYQCHSILAYKISIRLIRGP